jgi:hypothetical protein
LSPRHCAAQASSWANGEAALFVWADSRATSKRQSRGIPWTSRGILDFSMQNHDFTQRFLANERQFELDAEAERARLALLIRQRRRLATASRFAWLTSVARRGATGDFGASSPVTRGSRGD